MRTYTLESVSAKIANFEAFIVRAEAKKAKLPGLRAIRDGILSPENLVKAESRLERQKREIARLEASIKASKAIQEEKAEAENGENPVGWETAETENEDSGETEENEVFESAES